MAESFSRWESDPLFSAAEVVQDSADRMESVFRMVMHEEKLSLGCPLDTKLHVSIQYHKRDLVTALETTKWQLEDFERAVNLAASSDNTNSRENSISKFRQFINALREHVSQVELALKDSSADGGGGSSSRNSQTSSMNTNELDNNDGLAKFFSGADSKSHHLKFDPESSSIMKRFLDPVIDTNEIIELKTEGADHFLPTSLGPKMAEEVGTSFRALDMDFCGNPSEMCYTTNKQLISGLRGSISRFLGNLWWFSNKKNQESLTKRRKDGEVSYDLSDQLADAGRKLQGSSYISISPLTQVCRLQRLITTLQLRSWLDSMLLKLQRSQHLITHNRCMTRRTSIILVTLAILGIFAYHIV